VAQEVTRPECDRHPMRVRADRLIRMRWRQAFVHGPTLAFASIC